MEQREQTSGMSIFMLTIVLLVVALISMVISYVEADSTAQEAHSLYQLEQQRQLSDNAIQQFMDGSDYLTMQVQQFVVQADRVYMDNYWQEVNITRSRDQAVEYILAAEMTEEERAEAIEGKQESDRLILQETQAMRLVAESIGLDESEMPEEVAAYRLNPGQAALSPAEKRQAAISLIFGPVYSTAKEMIRSSVSAFRNEMDSRYAEEMLNALEETQRNSRSMKLLIMGFLLLLLITVAFYSGLVVLPIARYAAELGRLEAGQPVRLKERGAREIKQFVATFNSLYQQVEENTDRLERLSYFDYLTEVPNRANITEYVEQHIASGHADLGILMIDVDNFKRFNDTYGHAVGDRTLQEIAKAIQAGQGAEEGLAGRICGEEFIVVLPHTSKAKLQEVAERILSEVRGITGERIGLPLSADYYVTVSIGATLWDGVSEAGFIKLLSQADKALYRSKAEGKDRYTSPQE